jgi:hypothetical protein
MMAGPLLGTRARPAPRCAASRCLLDGGDRGVACLLGDREALLAVLELAVELGAQLAVGVQRGQRTLAGHVGGLGALLLAGQAGLEVLA